MLKAAKLWGGGSALEDNSLKDVEHIFPGTHIPEKHNSMFSPSEYSKLSRVTGRDTIQINVTASIISINPYNSEKIQYFCSFYNKKIEAWVIVTCRGIQSCQASTEPGKSLGS